MEVRTLIFIFVFLMPLACSAGVPKPAKFGNVYVQDFHSDKPEQCTTADVELGHKQAHEFFKRAKVVSHRTLHDHYEYAPCYIEGTLKYKSKSCDWKIRAGATGSVTYGKEVWYFACDECGDLFENK